MAKQKILFHFRTALIAVVLIALILHLGMTDTLSARELNKEITASVDSDNELIAEALSDKLAELLKRPAQELGVVALSMKNTNNQEAGFDEGIRITDQMRSFDRVLLVNAENKVVKVWPFNTYIFGMDQSGTRYAETLRDKRNAFWSGTYINYTNGQTAIDLVVPVTAGYLVGTIYLEDLNDVISSLKTKTDTIVAIVDRNGTYLAHSDPQRVQQREKDPYLRQNNLTGERAPGRDISLSGSMVRPFVKKMEEYGWTIVVYYPTSLYQKPVWALLGRMIAIQMISLIVVLMILVLCGNYFNAMTQRMVGFMRSIAAGDYRIESPPVYLSEFGDMIGSFKRMSKEIEGREEEIIEKSRQIQLLNEQLETKIIERTADLELANQNLTHTMQTLVATQGKLVQQEKLISLGSLVDGIAHEVNTPIGIGITTSTFLENELRIAMAQNEDGGLSHEELREFFETIQESARILSESLQRAGELIENFKHITVGQKSSDMVVSSMNDIVGAVLMESGLKLSGVSLTVKIEPEGLQIRCFPEEIVLILFNLLRNAIVHGLDGRKDGAIEILARQENQGVRIDVKDNGVGIPEENIKRVFDPFFTTRRGGSSSGGSGLGLNILYNLITNRYNGHIECKSKTNEGTTFCVSLPDCVA